MNENTLLRKLQRALQRADRAEESLREQQLRNLYLTQRIERIELEQEEQQQERK